MRTRLTSFVITVSLFFASAKDSFSQVNKRDLEKKVTIQSGAIRIDSLLNHFSRQTSLAFSFNSKRISPSKKLVVSSKRKTVSQWLLHLNESFGIQHKFVGNHIILIDNSGKKQVTQKTAGKKKDGPKKVNTFKNTSLQKGKPNVQPKSNVPVESIVTISQVADKIDTVRSENTVHLINENETLPDTSKKEKQAPLPQGVIANEASAQEQVTIRKTGDSDKDESLQVMLGYSKHGSGDMKGVVFGAEYWTSISPKLSLGFMLRATINSDKHTIVFNNTIAGTVTDASVRFTTAGVQLGATGGYHFINKKRHDLGVGLGMFGRYQSASNGSDGYGIIYPAITNYPGVLIEYFNRTPQHSFSFGGLLQFQYQYSLNDRLYTGIVAGFQTDTNGDAIPQVGLVFGKRFKRD